ncbi:hypothetical protein [Alistipes sp. ZOR0009]|uniref:RipA family octameric membrane protein n=1 Tax=Alistipes sp. ZOR0009 TaxID=1339253 RepID=UPI00064673AF|nr:hypothetical protein [Alistipes sp. ZOR0009]
MTDNSNLATNKVKESKFDRTELITLLQNFSNLRTGQDQVLWSITGAFWTTNSVLFVSIISADKERTIYVGLLISIIGISISWVWNHIQNSTLLRIQYYENAIKKIEKQLKFDFELCSFLRADSDEYAKKVNKKSARYVMRLFSKYAIIFWILLSVVFSILITKEILTK